MSAMTDLITMLTAHKIQFTCIDKTMSIGEDIFFVREVQIPDQTFPPFMLSYPTPSGITVWTFKEHNGALIGCIAYNKRFEDMQHSMDEQLKEWNSSGAKIVDPWKDLP